MVASLRLRQGKRTPIPVAQEKCICGARFLTALLCNHSPSSVSGVTRAVYMLGVNLILVLAEDFNEGGFPFPCVAPLTVMMNSVFHVSGSPVKRYPTGSICHWYPFLGLQKIEITIFIKSNFVGNPLFATERWGIIQIFYCVFVNYNVCWQSCSIFCLATII